MMQMKFQEVPYEASFSVLSVSASLVSNVPTVPHAGGDDFA